MALDSGGGGIGDSDTDTDADTETSTVDLEEAQRELRRRQPSGIDAGEPISGVDGQGSPRDDSEPSPVEGGSESVDGMGGGASSDAENTLTETDPGSGDAPDTQDIRDEVEPETDTTDTATTRDPTGGELTFRDPGSSGPVDPARAQEEHDSIQARQIADREVDTTLEEGVEREGSAFTAQAKDIEQEVIAESDLVDDPSDVAIRLEGDTLAPVLSRSRAVELAAEDIEAQIGEFREQRPRDLFRGSGPTLSQTDLPTEGFRQSGISPGESFESGSNEGEEGGVDEPLTDRVVGVLGDAKQEGVESIERGGSLSEAARNTTAAALGLAFQNPEEIGGRIGISEERIAQQGRNLSGPGVTEFDLKRDGLQPFELEYGPQGQLDEEVMADLTGGDGLLSEEQEAELREDIQQRRETFGLGDEAAAAVSTVTDDERIQNLAQGAGEFTGEALAAPAGLTLAGEKAVEVGGEVPDAVEEHGVGAVGFNLLESGGRATGRVTRFAQENPFQFIGGLAGAAVGGAAAGKALGAGARFSRDRVRTAGAKTFDLEEGAVVNQQTGRFHSPRSDVDAPEARFPGAQDAALYQSRPAAAVRKQADEFTPSEVEQRFEAAGVTEGTTLKKALDVEPEGPQRGGRGFQTQAGSFESPGGFVGPELSPNFLRIGSRRSSFSLRPGLPDFGDSATGVLVRTRVKEPNARNMDDFNTELLAREGQTTARTKPPGAGSPGEIEAVIPPEAKFADIGGGPIRSAARSVGVGSDFAVRIGGRRVPFTNRRIGGRKVPLRPVADPDLVETSSSRTFRDFLASERGQLGADAGTTTRGRTLSEIREPIRPATDRPLPLVPSTPTPSVDGTMPQYREGLTSGFDRGSPSFEVEGSERSISGSSTRTDRLVSGGSSPIGSASSPRSPPGGSGSSMSPVSEGGVSTPSSSSPPGSSTGTPPGSPGTPFSPTSSITLQPPTSPPATRGLDLEVRGSGRKKDNEFLSAGEQFVVAFAEPEDVIGENRGPSLDFGI